MSSSHKYRLHSYKTTHRTPAMDFGIEITRQYSPHKGRLGTDEPVSLHESPPWFTFDMYANSDFSEFHEDLYDGMFLCNIALIRRKDFMWETHCTDLTHELLGMGFGTLLYDHVVKFALKTNKTICSSHSTSESAKSVWRRMSDDYFIFSGMKNYIVLGPRQKTA